MLNFFRSLRSFRVSLATTSFVFDNSSSVTLRACFSGGCPPFSIIYYSKMLCFLSKLDRVWPRSAIISNRSFVMALRFPKARNQTLPLSYSGKPSIHISLTRLVRLTLSQFGKISVVQIFIIASTFSAALCPRLPSFRLESASLFSSSDKPFYPFLL